MESKNTSTQDQSQIAELARSKSSPMPSSSFLANIENEDYTLPKGNP